MNENLQEKQREVGDRIGKVLTDVHGVVVDCDAEDKALQTSFSEFWERCANPCCAVLLEEGEGARIAAEIEPDVLYSFSDSEWNGSMSPSPLLFRAINDRERKILVRMAEGLAIEMQELTETSSLWRWRIVTDSEDPPGEVESGSAAGQSFHLATPDASGYLKVCYGV